MQLRKSVVNWESLWAL
jgi:hypothetical protein